MKTFGFTIEDRKLGAFQKAFLLVKMYMDYRVASRCIGHDFCIIVRCENEVQEKQLATIIKHTDERYSQRNKKV